VNLSALGGYRFLESESTTGPKQKWRKAQRPAPLISPYIFRISNRGHLTGKISENISGLK
jgi:hypothetical protein